MSPDPGANGPGFRARGGYGAPSKYLNLPSPFFRLNQRRGVVRPRRKRTRRQPEAFAERLQNSREWERPASHAIPTGRSRWPYRVVKVGVMRDEQRATSDEKGGSDEKNRQWPYCGNKVGVMRDEQREKMG